MRRYVARLALARVGAAVWFVALSSTASTQGLPVVPKAYAPQPPGANLRVRMPASDGSGFQATVVNDDAREVVGLTFMVIVEVYGVDRPVRVLTSPEWILSLGTQQSMQLTNDWLNAAQLETLRTAPSERLQMFVTPGRIRYADGTEWTLEIDRTATRSLKALQKAFNLPPGV